MTKRFCECSKCPWCRMYDSDPGFRMHWEDVAGPRHWNLPPQEVTLKAVPFTVSRPMLGDQVKAALSSVGVTEEWVGSWLGGCGGCKERRDKLNALHSWAERAVKGTVEEARRWFAGLTG